MSLVKCPVCGEIREVKRPRPGNPPCRPCSNRAKARVNRRSTALSQRWFTRCKWNAANRGYEFCVTEHDILELWEKQDRKCALSGLDIGWAPFGRVHTISLDRIDNSLGYTRDNIQLLHKDINMLKHCFPQVYFVNLCRMIARWAVCG